MFAQWFTFIVLLVLALYGSVATVGSAIACYAFVGRITKDFIGVLIAAVLTVGLWWLAISNAPFTINLN